MRRVLFSRLDRDIFLFDHPFSTYVPVEEEAVLEKHTFTYDFGEAWDTNVSEEHHLRMDNDELEHPPEKQRCAHSPRKPGAREGTLRGPQVVTGKSLSSKATGPNFPSLQAEGVHMSGASHGPDFCRIGSGV